MEPPERLKKLPPYLFVEVDRKKRNRDQRNGVPVESKIRKVVYVKDD